ncbi:MAG: hypothetical protein ACYTFG_22325 [Planctomycetota bacterium]|jgi:hypothetical protein
MKRLEARGEPLSPERCDEIADSLNTGGETQAREFRIFGSMGTRMFASGERQVVHRVVEPPDPFDTEVKVAGWRCELRGVPAPADGGGETIEVWIRAKHFPAVRALSGGEVPVLEKDSIFVGTRKLARGGGVVLGDQQGGGGLLYLRFR